jgi:hypothetical protein
MPPNQPVPDMVTGPGGLPQIETAAGPGPSSACCVAPRLCPEPIFQTYIVHSCKPSVKKILFSFFERPSASTVCASRLCNLLSESPSVGSLARRSNVASTLIRRPKIAIASSCGAVKSFGGCSSFSRSRISCSNPMYTPMDDLRAWTSSKRFAFSFAFEHAAPASNWYWAFVRAALVVGPSGRPCTSEPSTKAKVTPAAAAIITPALATAAKRRTALSGLRSRGRSNASAATAELTTPAAMPIV